MPGPLARPTPIEVVVFLTVFHRFALDHRCGPEDRMQGSALRLHTVSLRVGFRKSQRKAPSSSPVPVFGAAHRGLCSVSCLWASQRPSALASADSTFPSSTVAMLKRICEACFNENSRPGAVR